MHVWNNASYRNSAEFLQCNESRLKDGLVASELVNDGALDESPFLWFQKSHGAIELSEDAASVDVSRQEHRGVYHAGKAHVHDIFLLQVDLSG